MCVMYNTVKAQHIHVVFMNFLVVRVMRRFSPWTFTLYMYMYMYVMYMYVMYIVHVHCTLQSTEPSLVVEGLR